MQISQVYLTVGVVVFFILVLLLFLSRNKRAQFSMVFLLAFVLVLAGIAFGENNNTLGFSFPALAVVLSVIDVFSAKKTQGRSRGNSVG